MMDRNTSATRTCQNCRAALDPNALICSSCGGVVPIEVASRLLRGHAVERLSHFLSALNERTLLLWILAAAPMLIGPPLLALWLTYVGSKGRRLLTREIIIVAAALINVIVSILFWRWLSETTFAVWPTIWHFLKSLATEGTPTVRSIQI